MLKKYFCYDYICSIFVEINLMLCKKKMCIFVVSVQFKVSNICYIQFLNGYCENDEFIIGIMLKLIYYFILEDKINICLFLFEIKIYFICQFI